MGYQDTECLDVSAQVLLDVVDLCVLLLESWVVIRRSASGGQGQKRQVMS